MAKLTTKFVNFKAVLNKYADLSEEIVSRETAKKAGKATVKAMKKDISKGTSPIRGKGKFPGYKNPSRYPGGRKGSRPVNLSLTGQMLRSLKSKAVKDRKAGFATEIFYQGNLANEKELGHRQGANAQPKRPTMPQGSEEFNTKITNTFAEIFFDAFKKALRKKT
jgi:hypothetical protein